MPKKDKLYALIAMLEPAEKRFVNNQLKHSQNQYQYELFSKIVYVLQKKVKWDESKLKEHLRKKTGYITVYPKQKFLLYENILKYLTVLYKRHEGSAWDSLEKVKILKKKGLWEEATKRLKKIIKKGELAEDFELLHASYRILFHLYDLYPFNRVKDKYYKAMEQAKHWLDIMKKKWLYEEMLLELHKIQGGIAKNPENRALLQEIFERFNANFSVVPRYLTLRIKHHEFLSFYYFIQGNVSKSLMYGERILRELKDNEDILKRKYDVFIAMLHNLVYVSSALESPGKMMGFIREMGAFLRKFPMGYKVDVMEFVLLSELMAHYYNKKTLNRKEIEEIIEEYKKYENTISPHNKIWVNWGIAMYFYKESQIEKAIKWIQYNINENPQHIGEYNYFIMLAALLLMYYENEEYELVPVFLRKLLYFTKRCVIRNKLERVFASCRAMYRRGEEQGLSIREVFEKTRRYLVGELKKINTNADIFDFQEWIRRQDC